MGAGAAWANIGASIAVLIALGTSFDIAYAAPADCDMPPEIPDTLVAELVDWIDHNTDYDVSKTRNNPPSISFCSTGEIIRYEGADILVNSELRAAYDMPRRHIFLVRPWRPDDLFDQSRLLHELIHDVQLINRGWECLQKPEWDAYKLQEHWLMTHGIDPEFNWMVIYFMSKCPRDIHP